MEASRYHKLLRISMFIAAAALVFDSGLLSPVSKQLSDNTIQYLGNAIGIFAQVEPNEINVITAELTERSKLLDEREAALNEREIAARDYTPEESTDYSTYILSTILFILTVLIVLNYALDWARIRQRNHEQQTA